MPITPEQRREYGSLGGLTSWVNTENRRERIYGATCCRRELCTIQRLSRNAPTSVRRFYDQMALAFTAARYLCLRAKYGCEL